MEDETTILCNYKHGRMSFIEGTGEFDGEYIFVANRPEDFSLYTTDAFRALQEKIFEAKEKRNDQHSNLIARYLFARAEIVTVSDGGFDVPARDWLDVHSESFEAKAYADHIRFISFNRKEAYENEKDVIEMTLQKISE